MLKKKVAFITWLSSLADSILWAIYPPPPGSAPGYQEFHHWMAKGIINIGGKKQSIYNFALQSNRRIKKDLAKKDQIPVNSTLNLKKMKLALKS